MKNTHISEEDNILRLRPMLREHYLRPGAGHPRHDRRRTWQRTTVLTRLHIAMVTAALPPCVQRLRPSQASCGTRRQVAATTCRVATRTVFHLVAALHVVAIATIFIAHCARDERGRSKHGRATATVASSTWATL